MADSDDDFQEDRKGFHLEPGVLPSASGRDPSSVDLLKGISSAPTESHKPIELFSLGEGEKEKPVSPAPLEISSVPEASSGSSGGGAESTPKAAPQPLDLNSTSPWEDFFYLFYRPKDFFSYFARPGSLPGWVTIKAIAGLCFLIWLSAFVTAPKNFEEIASHLLPAIDELRRALTERFPWMLELGAEDMQSRASVMLLAFLQMMVVLRPFFTLVMLLLTAATAYVFLPMVGAPKEKRSFVKLYVAGIFANWYVIASVVPAVGPWLAFALEVVFYTLAVKWIYGISFLRSFAALYILGWILSVILLVVMGVTFAVVFAVLSS